MKPVKVACLTMILFLTAIRFTSAAAAPEQDDSYLEEEYAQSVTIADPIEPWNKAMYHFNDKLYFWVLKPVARGYAFVVPEPARVAVHNIYDNIRAAHPDRQQFASA